MCLINENKILKILKESKIEIKNKVIAVVLEKDIFFENLINLEKEIKKLKNNFSENIIKPCLELCLDMQLRNLMKRKGGVILIEGGSDKGLDSTALATAIQTHTKKCILLKGTGTVKLLTHGSAFGAEVVGNLEEAVQIAYSNATEGDAILFSPAFASFGMFTNEYDRGEQFIRLVTNLK